MAVKIVLFDLDGTLLPMDQDVFVKTYFGLLAKRLAPLGYEPTELINSVWAGTKAMIKNTGEKTNEEVFWDDFASRYGEEARKDLPEFDAFYREDFDKVKGVCGFNPKSKEVIYFLKEKGIRVALATNPIFPAIATEKRIAWAGLSPEDFELYTTYENSNYCKPNPEYYKEIVKQLNIKPEECLMVGNDVVDDMVAEKLGMKVFLLTDCLINKNNIDISVYPHGNFSDLIRFILE